MTLAAILKDVSAFLEQHVHGWCDEEKAHALAAAVYTLRPKVIVEIGVWSGRSLIPMAMAAKRSSEAIVFGIDPWKPQESEKDQDSKNAEWWASVNHEEIYEYFMSQLKQFDIDNVEIWRAPSNNITISDTQIGLLHIDGNHSEQELIDIKRYGKLVQNGGLMCVDDIAWADRPWDVAIQHIQSLGFVELYRIGTGAMFQRV